MRKSCMERFCSSLKGKEKGGGLQIWLLLDQIKIQQIRIVPYGSRFKSPGWSWIWIRIQYPDPDPASEIEL